MSNLEYWIWLASRHVRAGTKRALLERFGDARGVYFAGERELKDIEGLRPEELAALSDKDTSAAGVILRRCREENVDVLTLQDAAYPERLRNIPDPPSVLYVRGRLPDLDAEAAVAVVGTRKSTPYGEKMARGLAYEIVSKGGVVVTGLAGGIDSRAAEGALLAGGPVIGVLGVAINEVYPKYNADLYADVAAAGALVSEYPPDAEGSAAWFPLRNRIMAGLSVGVLVVEAPLRSGALITAHRAVEYGRDVFAVPGNADAYGSRGCNNLLREGAAVAETGWDVLREYEARFPGKITRAGRDSIPEEFALPEGNVPPEKETTEKREAAEVPEVRKGREFFKFRTKNRKAEEEKASALERQLEGLNENQLKIVGVLKRPHTHVDDIVDLSGLPAATVLSELTMLQIKGYVSQEAGKRFTLNIR